MPEDLTTAETAATEDITAEASSEQTATTETQGETILETVAPKIINDDGSFTDTWREILPEELRDEKMLDTVKDLPNAIKQLVSHKKMIGKDKVVLPTDKSTPEEWDEFYTAVGRPKTPEGYKVDVPEDLKEVFTAERMAETQKLAHDLGITGSQYERYMQNDMKNAEAMLQQIEEADIQARANADKLLRQEFKGAYDDSMLAAKRIVAEAIPNEEQRLDFLEKFGDNPDFIRFAAVVGARMSESSALVAELRHDAPQEIGKKIAELNKTPGYMGTYRDSNGQMKQMDAEERASITAQIREYQKQLNPEPQRMEVRGLG